MLSRIVQARLPICAAIVTQFVTHSGATLVTRSESAGNRWSSDTPTPSDAPFAVDQRTGEGVLKQDMNPRGMRYATAVPLGAT